MNNDDRSKRQKEKKCRYREETEKRKCLERNANTQKGQEKILEDDKEAQQVKGDARRSPLYWD